MKEYSYSATEQRNYSYFTPLEGGGGEEGGGRYRMPIDQLLQNISSLFGEINTVLQDKYGDDCEFIINGEEDWQITKGEVLINKGQGVGSFVSYVQSLNV